MQHSGSTGNARKEDRVPLGALVALSFDDGSDVLEADGIDVSPRGLSLRANFLPEVGTRMMCRFHCPPHQEPVSAVGEVAWGHWQSRDDSVFGMRFVELDTKSATTIRRLLEPALPTHDAPKAKPRVAQLSIEGLEVPIETEVKRADPNLIVLEQDLTFLRLGRNVQVDMGGRGSARGRIASIELRHGPLDVPTLVFGVLLDGAREAETVELPVHEPVRARRAQVAQAPALDPPFGEREAPAQARIDSLAGARADDSLDALPITGYETTVAAGREPMFVQRAIEEELADTGYEDEELAGESDAPIHEAVTTTAIAPRAPSEAMIALRSAWVDARARLEALRARWTRKEAHAEDSDEPATPRSPLLTLVHASGRVTASVQSLFKRTARSPKRRTTSPAPARVVRAQTPKAQTAKPAVPARAARNQRLYAAAFLIIGVSIGIYALAPRSGADRIQAGRFAASAPEAAPPAPAVAAPLAPTVEPMVAAPAAAPVLNEPALEEPSGPAPFGEANIENGRTHVLRMSGSVRTIEGEARDDGFTVRIPGRLALDRASPIAAANRSVARAMVLNRGEYAELTVDFLPGMRPKYSVVGKGNTLEVTIE